jgi:hypothetical protein
MMLHTPRVHLNNTVPKRQDLAERLRTAGCAVNTIGTDWHEAGDLTPPVAPRGMTAARAQLPKSQSSPVPRLDGRYIDNRSRRLSAIEITNHGPGDVYELDLEDAERDGIRLQDIELPSQGCQRARGSASSATGSIRLVRSAAPIHHRGYPGRPSTAYRSEKIGVGAGQTRLSALDHCLARK